MSALRRPWPADFPRIVTHTTVKIRDSHADYLAAKTGDLDAAGRLASDLVSEAAVVELGAFFGKQRPVLAAATAEEADGFNAIPDAVARLIADRLDVERSLGIVQTNVVGHTRADGFHRLAFPAEFDGPISGGQDYIIVDDHVGLGGTIAELRAHIELGGGRVVGATTLTKSRDSDYIPLTRITLESLRAKHGDALEEFWQKKFGYGLECLTEPEAGYLLRAASADAIRDRIAAAEAEGRRLGFQSTSSEVLATDPNGARE
jgi:hypothetical protein